MVILCLKKYIIRKCIPKERYLYTGDSYYKFFLELVLIAVGNKKMARFTFLLHHLMGNCIFTCRDPKGNEQTNDRQEDSHCTKNADGRQKFVHDNTVRQLFKQRRK